MFLIKGTYSKGIAIPVKGSPTRRLVSFISREPVARH